MVQVTMRDEHGVCLGRGFVEFVQTLNFRQNPKFLQASLAPRRQERRRIKQFLLAKRHAKIKEYSRVAVLEKDFVSAYFVDAAVER